jgi:hypothetical protein
MTDNSELKDKVCEYISEHRGVTFVELERLLSDEIEVRGEYNITSSKDDNIIFWINVSEQFADIINELIASGRVDISATRPFVYAVDGKQIAMDTAKQPPKDGYKNPHWLPLQFNPPDTE